MTVPTPDSQPQEVKVSDKELNFRKLEQKLEQERQARIQAEQRAEEAERAKKARVEDDDDDSEPYVDHKKLNKKLANFERDMEKKIDERAETKAAALLEQERRASYLRDNADFNSTMNPDTIEKFANKYPKLAENILRMPDGFERQKLVYENIKALGVDKPEVKGPSIQEKIDQNRKSPFYQPTGVGSAPYSAAGDYSKTGQKTAFDKMQELKNRLRLG